MTEDLQKDETQLQSWLAALRLRLSENDAYTAADFFADHPEATSRAIDAVELVYEEYCLRRRQGVAESASEVASRYPQWRSKLEVVFECDRILTEEDEDIQFPVPGERFNDFDLHRELGRGAKGRVFLATQPSLSDRPVVLKLSSRTGIEHLSLARLQHSAIVPLLFCQDAESRGIRLLCMPYLGGCTLDQAMRSMAAVDVSERTGRDFVEAIERHDPELKDSFTGRAADRPAMRFMSSATYEQAVCWIIGCLSEGLHYAHQRGLVHLDVKPSNVLLTSDGQPMLLDFHLARELSQLADHQFESIGGTPGYMSPEHRDAFRATRRGADTTGQIDQRCDIYSLGLLMHDLLSGALSPPVDTQEESPVRRELTVGELSKLASPGVASLLQRCLAKDPGSRFADAGELAVELRRVAVGDSDHSQRGRLLSGVAIGVALSSLVFWGYDKLIRTQPKPQAVPVVLAQPQPRIIDELHTLVAQTRANDILNTGNEIELRQLRDSCASLWQRRSALMAVVEGSENRAGAERLHNDLQDLATLYRELLVRLADPQSADAAQAAAERVRREAADDLQQ